MSLVTELLFSSTELTVEEIKSLETPNNINYLLKSSGLVKYKQGCYVQSWICRGSSAFTHCYLLKVRTIPIAIHKVGVFNSLKSSIIRPKIVQKCFSFKQILVSVTMI